MEMQIIDDKFLAEIKAAANWREQAPIETQDPVFITSITFDDGDWYLITSLNNNQETFINFIRGDNDPYQWVAENCVE